MDPVTPQGSLPIDLSVSQPNTEGPSAMFGMVTALVVQEQASALGRRASAVLPGVTDGCRRRSRPNCGAERRVVGLHLPGAGHRLIAPDGRDSTGPVLIVRSARRA